ncbi:hypothetical protein [Echinicola salinicaeni]|uniref:hypothetical protein n=1 Tax=Echinicola salinicaeni TaxID=2762757 RepID=UPI0016474F65|nr:hypothetical protein [Echinicola salinicaeni]
MKLILNLLILLTTIAINNVHAQSSVPDTYQLVKGGKSYPKINLYLFYNPDHGWTKDTINNKTVFKNGKDLFSLAPSKTQGMEISEDEYDEIEFTNVKNLYEIESLEINKRSEQIEKTEKRKLIPPLDHRVLKLHLIKEYNGSYYVYIVDWTSLTY